jgi:hypothetical protein
MKNINIILKKAVLCIIFTLMTVIGYAQPPHCDTCVYDYDHTWNPKYLDSVVVYSPPQTLSEFDSCANGTLKKKNITFIHGLGGGIASWDKQKTWTDQNYQSAVIIGEYTGASWENSFHSVAQKLNNDIGSGLANGVDQSYPNRCPDNDFAIAHSQGGIAARYMDRQWDINTNGTFGNRKFNGLVTFATPHAGADIALTRTQHGAFIGKIVDAIFLEGLYDLRGFSNKLDKLLDTKNVFIEEKLAPIMIAGVHTNSLDEMRYDNQTMININNHQSRLNKVAFYGIEDAPECWRVISNLTDTASEEYPIWTATKDNFFVDKAQEAEDNHIGEINANNRKIKRNKNIIKASTAVTLLPGGWGIRLLTGAATAGLVLQNKRLDSENSERNKAVNFLDNANTEWRYLIGSYHRDSFTTKTETRHKVTWEEKYGFGGKWYSQERTNFPEWWDAQAHYNNVNVYKKRNMQLSTYTITHKLQTFYPSDGVVLKKSQLAFPGVDLKNTREMNGDSHFQERNSPNARDLFIDLYKGKFGKFFRTEEI